MTRTRSKCLALIAILLSPLAANADLIIGASEISSNSMGTAAGSIENIINQSGLSAGYTSGVTDFASYMATHPTNDASNAWAGLEGPVLGEIVFDLGDIFNVTSFVLWTQNNFNAIDAFDILVDGILAGSFNALIGTGSNIDAQIFSLTPMSGQFVTLQVHSNHGGFNVNIGEVAFGSVSVPEPGTLALLGIGLFAIGLARRRKV